MVLDHVAQCACAVIKSTALFNANVFGNRDLNIGNVLTPPERFKQCVAKTQRKQVLYRRFAQVVVNPENLLFVKHFAHTGVDGPVRRQTVTKWLFQHHPHVGAAHAGGCNLLAKNREQRRCGSQVHHHCVSNVLLKFGSQPLVVGGVGQIHAQVKQQRCKARKFFFRRAFGQFNLVKT